MEALGLIPPTHTCNLLIRVLSPCHFKFSPHQRDWASDHIDHMDLHFWDSLLGSVNCISLGPWGRGTIGCLECNEGLTGREYSSEVQSRLRQGIAARAEMGSQCGSSQFILSWMETTVCCCHEQNITESHLPSPEGLGIKGPWHTGLCWLSDTCLQPVSVLWSPGRPFNMSKKKSSKWFYTCDFSQFLNTSSYLWI